MSTDVVLVYADSPSEITIQLPVSKSESNRAQIISFLSGGKVTALNFSDAKDSSTLYSLISQISDGKVFYLNCGPAGTTFRFLLSVAAINYGEWTLTGSERMKQRPIGILVEALRTLGAEIDYLEKEGFPPLKIKGKELIGGKITIDAGTSSQFVSSLLMIAPVLKNGLEIEFKNKVVSLPYIKMTLEMMKRCGADFQVTENKIRIHQRYYSKAEILCENDWSAASYFYSLVAVNKKLKIHLPGLKQESLQGDSIVRNIYEIFGVETIFDEKGITIYNNETVYCDYFEFDFSDCPDLAQTLAFTCVALQIEGKLNGLSTLKNKETDRIVALKNELTKCGMDCKITDDSISFSVKNKIPDEVVFETYEDHRMAMAETVMAMVCKKITIRDKEVVEKSFPKFWEELGKVLQ